MTAPSPETMRRFVEEEARLLDDRDFDAWLRLFAADACYWVPVSPRQERPSDGVSHFHDDKQVLMARTHRLLNPRAFGAEPPPRTAHAVSGVRIDSASEDEVVVSSSQLMLEYRSRGQFEDDLRMFGGRVTHRLRPDGAGDWLIAMKRVDLINSDGAFNAMLAPL